MKSFFTPKDVCLLVNISYRQVQYWDRSNFIKPSYRRKGRYRLYTFADLLQLWLAKRLRDHGHSIQELRLLIKSVRGLMAQASVPLMELRFIFDKKVVTVYSGEMLSASTSGKDLESVFGKDYIRIDVAELQAQVDALFPQQVLPLSGE